LRDFSLRHQSSLIAGLFVHQATMQRLSPEGSLRSAVRRWLQGRIGDGFVAWRSERWWEVSMAVPMRAMALTRSGIACGCDNASPGIERMTTDRERQLGGHARLEREQPLAADAV